MTNEDDRTQADRRRHHQIGRLAICLAITISAMGAIIWVEIVSFIIALFAGSG